MASVSEGPMEAAEHARIRTGFTAELIATVESQAARSLLRTAHVSSPQRDALSRAEASARLAEEEAFSREGKASEGETSDGESTDSRTSEGELPNRNKHATY